MSARFSFRLARLLRVRSVLEGESRAAFGAAASVASSAEAEAHRLAVDLSAARREAAALTAPGSIEPRAVLCAEVAETSRRARLGAKRHEARTLRFQADQLRSSWLDRRVERESLSRLEERARQNWLAERAAIENAWVDETAGRRHHEKTSGRSEPGSPSGDRAPAADGRSLGASDRPSPGDPEG